MKMKKLVLILIICLLMIIPINNNQTKIKENLVVVETGTIHLNQTKMTLGINYSSLLKATASSNISSSKIIWSSDDTKIATVDANGKVTGKSTGTTYITASIGNNKSICTITVIENYIAVNKVSLNKNSLSLVVGNEEILTASLSPENASNKSTLWSSSNPEVATVDNNGKITAKSLGTTYITATSGESKTTCVVTVVDKISLASISTKSSITIKELDKTKLSVTYNPNNATNKKVTWKSSNSNIATVDQNGVVTGISAGSATITVISNDGGKVATCKVIVEAISKKINNISLNKTELTLVAGTEETLTVKYDPEYAENKKITWTSSNERVAIVEKGKITTIRPGNVEIKAVSEDGKKEAICQLTVTSPPIKSITFETDKQTVYLDSEITLSPTVTPENSVLENAIWTSSDENIATIKNGTLYAKSLGTVTITVSTEDKKIEASTEVTIIEKPKEPLLITIDNYNLNFNPEIKDYKLEIGSEEKLTIKTNVDTKKVTIKGNQDLKNGSIITITIKDEETTTYIINIKKKENLTLYFIGAISVLLFINIIRILIKNKQKKKA